MIIKNYLYNKSIEIIFNEFKHTYFINGEKIPSVTKILSVIDKPALLNWGVKTAIDYCREEIKPGIMMDEIQLHTVFEDAKKAHWKKKTDAGDLGTMIHKWIEGYIKGEDPKMPFHEGFRNAVEQFLKWKEEYDVKFLLSEQIIFSKAHKYTGTLDFIAKVKGKLVLGDIKTSSGIYDSYWLQLAAYRIARVEEYPAEKYLSNGIIRVGKDGTFEWQETDDWGHHAEAFIAAKTLYEVLERMKGEKEEV